MKNMSCILIVTLLAAGASAQSRPHWTATTPNDTNYKLFFVGRSTQSESEVEGIQHAAKDAREQLIRQTFGTTGRFHLAEPGSFSDRSHRSVSDVMFS